MYFGLLACWSIAKKIRQLDHSVYCTISVGYSSIEKTYSEVDDILAFKCLLWALNRYKIINQIQSLEIYKATNFFCNKCLDSLRLLDLECLVFINYLDGNYRHNRIATIMLVNLLLTEHSKLRKIRLELVNSMCLRFPQSVEMLVTGSN